MCCDSSVTHSVDWCRAVESALFRLCIILDAGGSRPQTDSRLSASGCMKHNWLNNLEEKAKRHRVRLKSQLRLQSYLAAHRQWKKHFYAVAAANRLKRFQQNRSVSTP
ncbi:hypothetical protein SRHO_G00304070 [Serrasalmus rhombeus]